MTEPKPLNSDITIQVVENGYIVRPGTYARHDAMIKSEYVCTTRVELDSLLTQLMEIPEIDAMGFGRTKGVTTK